MTLRTFTAIPLALLLTLAACGEHSPPEPGDAPAQARNGASVVVDLIDARLGDWVFINYWATWCKPCIKEIPELNSLDEEDGFSVLGVNFDGAEGEELAAQVAALEVAFPTLTADPGDRYGVARPQVLPTTLIIDPRGQLVAVLIGPQTAESLMAAAAPSAAPAAASGDD